MRTITLCICALLAFSLSLCAAQSPVGQGQKVIHDPVEYNEYITVLNTRDPSQKAAAMEAFTAKYPGSVVLEDALEQLLAAYQAAGKTTELESTANRILELNENNVRALAIRVALTRSELNSGAKRPKPPDLRVLAERGIRVLPEWQNREQLSEPDFEKLKNQMSVIFHGGAGFAALQRKDFTAARGFYTPAVALDPDDLQNTYQLSVADLEMNPIDINGLWYCAKAMQLAQKQNNAQAANSMVAYCKAKYKRFHGGEDGWDQILRQAAAAKTPGPPPDFEVTPAAHASAVPDATAASLTSNPSPGNAHNVSASILSADRASAGVALAGVSTPASVLSAATSGNAHSVPASVLSANSPGTAHNVQASVTSSGPRAQGFSAGIAASVLQTASASAAAVGRGLTALSKSLSFQLR